MDLYIFNENIPFAQDVISNLKLNHLAYDDIRAVKDNTSYTKNLEGCTNVIHITSSLQEERYNLHELQRRHYFGTLWNMGIPYSNHKDGWFRELVELPDRRSIFFQEENNATRVRVLKEVERAKSYIKKMLCGRELLSKTLIMEARNYGLGERTLRRARSELGVVAFQRKSNGVVRFFVRMPSKARKKQTAKNEKTDDSKKKAKDRDHAPRTWGIPFLKRK